MVRPSLGCARNARMLGRDTLPLGSLPTDSSHLTLGRHLVNICLYNSIYIYMHISL